MEVDKIINELEKITEKNIHMNMDENSMKKSMRNMSVLFIELILRIIKTPFKILSKLIQNDIVSAIKNDVVLYAVIMGIMGVLFVFFSVLWLFISVVIGIYFYDKGNTIFVSVLYSIIFQLISFIFFSGIAFVATLNLKSFKLVKTVQDFYNSKKDSKTSSNLF